MRPLSETKALEKLHRLKQDLAERIRDGWEHKAKSCATCPTPGACCLDEHFVNVHITRLEARAITTVLDGLSEERRRRANQRIARAISEYGLTADGDTFERTYACPLFEKGVGCLVHARGKPVPCVIHACYENREDLPPDDIEAEASASVEHLNRRTYGRPTNWLPLPLALAALDDERHRDARYRFESQGSRVCSAGS
jgi:hypothetical protein